MVSILAPGSSYPEFNSQHPKKISEETFFDATEVNQRCWLEESGQWPKNIERTRLVLASQYNNSNKKVCSV